MHKYVSSMLHLLGQNKSLKTINSIVSAIEFVMEPNGNLN